MKNINKIIICSILVLNLSSCFNSNVDDEVTKAKQNLWIIENDNSNLDSNPIDEIDNENNTENQETENILKDEKKIEIINLTSEKFLEFNSLDWVNLLWWEVEITWNTLTWVDEITVEFKNEESNYPDDKYTLKTFSPWDKTFKYRAFSNYETLDFWTNEYIFTAKSKNEISQTKIILRVIKNSQDNENQKENIVWNINLELMPIWENFWTPKQIWSWKITYSDIKWLEIEKKDNNTINCEINPETNKYYLSELLDKIVKWNYWWNTCRPFWNNNWISYYVLKLDWNSYIYERHIYLNNWIYWTYELEKWENFILEGESSEQINNKLKDKNNELKELNSTYTTVEIVNDLFTKILNNIN